MKFPTVTESVCPTDIPGGGGSSGDVPSLVLKPGLLMGCVGMAIGTNENILIVTGAGEEGANGTYHKTSDTSYNQEGGGHVILFIEDIWQLYNEGSVVLYTLDSSSPIGDWSGDAPTPTVAYGAATAFRTFIKTDNSGEVEVTTGLNYQSSNNSVVAIDSTTGEATLLSAGIVTITVTYGSLSAFAQVQVIGDGDDCCSDVKVCTLVAIDDSKSMSLPVFSGLSRLDWAKQAAVAFFGAMRWDKDIGGLMRFDVGTTVVDAIDSTEPSFATVMGIPATTQQTDFEELLDDAIALLQAETADRLVLVIISDGENRPDASGVIPSPATILAKATAFKNSGGVIVCVGVGASGDGFALLQAMASGGFFVNAYDASTGASAITTLVGFLCYYCGGLPPSYGQCLTVPPGEQVPAPDPLPDPELSSAQLYTSTREVCVLCGASENAVPVVTENDTEDGLAYASDETAPAWRAFDDDDSTYWKGTGLPASVGWRFNSAKTIQAYGLVYAGTMPKDFTFEGSNNGTSWTVLDTRTDVLDWQVGALKLFVVDSPGSYTYYRINITELFPTAALAAAIKRFEMYETAGEERCATETRSSYVSQDDADALAFAAAQTAAEALCEESNNTALIQFANGTDAPASPYPTRKIVSGLTGVISKVTVTLFGLTRTDGAPMGLLLVSPSGTAVLLAYVTADAVSRPFNNVDIELDDDAATPIPFETSTGPIAAGSYQPTVLNSGESHALPSPAPQGVPYGTTLAEFDGENPNGEWQLWAYHRNFFTVFNPANYRIAGGWDVDIDTV